MPSGIAISALFVVLWSTGFIGAKLGLPHAESMTFLALRFALVAAVLFIWVAVSGARWLTRAQVRDQALIGALVHFIYLGGVFAGIEQGVEAGVAAMIVGLQPVAMAVLARYLLGEHLVPVQWVGMILGLGGVGLVVLRKLDAGLGTPAGVLLCAAALVGISFGAILQKRLSGDTPMRAGNAVQFLVAALGCGAMALLFERMQIRWAPEFILALSWSVVVLSIGAVAILYWLIQRGAAGEVASLFFLVPPCTAVIAWPLFGEVLGWAEIGGMALAALGVLLVNRPGIIGSRAAS
ncbi:MAG: DMT family transporter [Paracoccaceae bacterium]